jgi:carbon-monoxide dehydrogenase medium subunit
VLVDIGRLSDLSYIRDAGDHVAIGALTRHHDLETSDLLGEHAPLLRHAASQVGDPQVRHRGTIGGSIAHADPASDLPATTLALGATYMAQGPDGTREIAATDFYESFMMSALAPDELLTEIRVPKMTGAGWSFQKFNRRAQDWAIVGVAAWRRNGDAGIGLVNMGSTPILATSVAAALKGGASTAERPQRERRVSPAPGEGPHPPRPGASERRLSAATSPPRSPAATRSGHSPAHIREGE